jgi:hypothetical protein
MLISSLRAVSSPSANIPLDLPQVSGETSLEARGYVQQGPDQQSVSPHFCTWVSLHNIYYTLLIKHGYVCEEPGSEQAFRATVD